MTGDWRLACSWKLYLLEVNAVGLLTWVRCELNVARLPIPISCEHCLECYGLTNASKAEDGGSNLQRVSKPNK
jgi:hypothetical protein